MSCQWAYILVAIDGKQSCFEVVCFFPSEQNILIYGVCEDFYPLGKKFPLELWRQTNTFRPLNSLSQPTELRFLQHFGTFPQQMWKYRRPSWSINFSSWSIHLLSTLNLNIHFKIICLWKSGLLEWLHLIIQWAKLYTLFPRESLFRDYVSKTWDLWTQKRIQATSTFWVLGSILCLQESFRPPSERSLLFSHCDM